MTMPQEKILETITQMLTLQSQGAMLLMKLERRVEVLEKLLLATVNILSRERNITTKAEDLLRDLD